MLLTKQISGAIVHHYKLLPILLMLLVWWFFTGARAIFRTRKKLIRRELLFCASVFGLAFGFVNFLVYGLVDPANGLARPGALPVPAEDFLRFERLAYASIAIGIVAFLILEISFWGEKRAGEKGST